MYYIRAAKISDLENIKKLGKNTSFRMTSKNKFYEDDEIKEFIKNKKTNILIILSVDGKIKGLLYAKLISRAWVMLDGLYIHPSMRNKGFGTRMLDALRKEMLKRKVHYVNGLVDMADKSTQKFLRRQGYSFGKAYYWVEKEPI